MIPDICINCQLKNYCFKKKEAPDIEKCDDKICNNFSIFTLKNPLKLKTQKQRG